jgi:hypothetical protein
VPGQGEPHRHVLDPGMASKVAWSARAVTVLVAAQRPSEDEPEPFPR